MSDREKHPPIDAVIAAAKSGTRSPLYDYLLAEYDSLLPVLSAHPVNWAAMVEEFKKAGIKAGRGTEPTVQSVRQTWHRIRTEKSGKKKTPGKKVTRLKDQWKS